MGKIFFTVFFVAAAVFGNELQKLKTYTLAKDEVKKILVKTQRSQKVLKFRWTLYKNEGLVFFTSFDQIVSQHILYLNHTNQSLRIDLIPRGAHDYVEPYLLLHFDEFDFTAHKAKISLWIYDKRSETILKYLQ